MKSQALSQSLISYKMDLHLHSSEDPKDSLSYDAYQLIDTLVARGFTIAAITLHDYVLEDRAVFVYAEQKGLFLLRGTEMHIEGKEVLIYNINEQERRSLKTFRDLKELRRRKEIFVIAPHPFYPARDVLGTSIYKHAQLFDALEWCYFYPRWFNGFNWLAQRAARKLKKPLIANSDAHALELVGKNNWTELLLPSSQKLSSHSIFTAMRNGMVKITSSPLSTKTIVSTVTHHFLPRKRRNQR